jgi:hypothetical protein
MREKEKKMEWERERWELGRGRDEEVGGTIKMDCMRGKGKLGVGKSMF